MKRGLDWREEAAAAIDAIFHRHGVRLTLGGEPTFLPLTPEGPEWSFAAVGPTKLDYARRIAAVLVARALPGAVTFFCPGKSYPGEPNPRWVVRVIAARDGSQVFAQPTNPPRKTAQLGPFRKAVAGALGVRPEWTEFSLPDGRRPVAWALPLDHDGTNWVTGRWELPASESVLSEADGPAGLRLPLHKMPKTLARRVLVVEDCPDGVAVFVPPLLQGPFLELLAAVQKALEAHRPGVIHFQGYTPSDAAGLWTVIGLAADPGVLEINLPACHSWGEYADWMEVVTASCESEGMRSWKENGWDHPSGTGGGNHLLWGGPSLDEHPFFTRPKWLAAIVRRWQHHPCLAYLFTGCYVGASSQAPRPDESARDLYDLEMAYAFLESLPPGDHRGVINETLRHLQTDVTGNAHRSEISFDKFWNVSWPGGALGLIEFRAIESLPRADLSAAVALLWSALAAHTLEHGAPRSLKRFGRRLHDAYFLPSVLWSDLAKLLGLLRTDGIALDSVPFREIWEWRFPALLEFRKGRAELTVRQALENWPLLCETPVEGGTTSRFVDTSMQRIEFRANQDFANTFDIHVAGRLLHLKPADDIGPLAGLRYRRTNLYPSLHPGIPVQVPLAVTLVSKKTGRVAAEFVMGPTEKVFTEVETKGVVALGGKPCRGSHAGDLTCDLRLA